MKVTSPIRGILSILVVGAVYVFATGVASAQSLIVNDPAGGHAAIGSDYTLSVSLDQQPAATVNVEVGVTGALKTSSPVSGVLAFTTSDWSTPQTVVVATAGDGTITLAPTNAAIDSATVSISTATVAYAAPPPTAITLAFGVNYDYTLDTEPVFVRENAPGIPVEITAHLDSLAEADLAVTLKFDGTATLGADYATSAFTIIIPQGATSGTNIVYVTTVNDSVYEEEEESIDVSVDTAVYLSGAATPPGGGGSLSIAILDDDDPPQVYILTNNDRISENGGEAIVTVYLSEACERTVTATVLIGGDAVPIFDYVTDVTLDGAGTLESPYSATFEILPGDSSASMTIFAALDTEDEFWESIRLTIDYITLVNATSGYPAVASVRISDADRIGSDASAGGSGGGGGGGCAIAALGSLSSLLPLLSVLMFAGFMRRRK